MVDLEELAEVESDDGPNIVALVDRSEEESEVALGDQGDWAGARILRLGNGEFSTLSELGDVNTGDPALLADFISESIKENPADHYGLVISDHGASWPGIGPDDSFDDSLEARRAADRARRWPGSCGRRAARCPRLRRLPHGQLRGGERHGAVRRPDDRLGAARTWPWLGLPVVPGARRRGRCRHVRASGDRGVCRTGRRVRYRTGHHPLAPRSDQDGRPRPGDRGLCRCPHRARGQRCACGG